MHKRSENAVDFLLPDAVPPRSAHVDMRRLKSKLKPKRAPRRPAGVLLGRECLFDSRRPAAREDHGDAIRGLRYAIPASALFWTAILVAVQVFT